MVIIKEVCISVTCGLVEVVKNDSNCLIYIFDSSDDLPILTGIEDVVIEYTDGIVKILRQRPDIVVKVGGYNDGKCI